MMCVFCRTCDHLVCADCVSYKHNKHNFEPIEKILPEKLYELKGAEARYSKDLTLCQAKVKEFQISETKYESLCAQVLQNTHIICVLCSVHGILSVIIFGCTS
jgi:hypothetical protein